ncbi:MAG TPA: ABC transporter ATP-binding protein [Ktedonobacterales bacterium]|nr:ABC transporter ATP-binding protein [Ktedonobacterales bacterium]
MIDEGRMIQSTTGVAPDEDRVNTTEQVAVRLDGLAKSFGSVRAVDDLSLVIRPGETVALLGPNGAGKTTTVSMLLGLLTPDSGTASVLGMAPTAAIQSGRIGAMLQEGNLMPGVRISELLDYVLSLRSSPMTRAELVEMAQLQGMEKRRIDRLSGGQTQRVRFALAIASNPEVLVLDEPTSAMDVEARHDFWASMRKYVSGGRTVLFATHYLEEAEAFASRVVVIASGRIVADGTVAELKRGAGMRTVQFQSREAGARQWQALAGVKTADVYRERVTLKTTDADATVRALAGGDFDWKDLDVRGASLEDVFMELVGNGHARNGGN